MKLMISKDFCRAKISTVLQHLVLSINLPDNYADWDQEKNGSPAEYERRRKSVILESCVMIFIHTISNILMIVPIWVTGILTGIHPIICSTLQL